MTELQSNIHSLVYMSTYISDHKLRLWVVHDLRNTPETPQSTDVGSARICGIEKHHRVQTLVVQNLWHTSQISLGTVFTLLELQTYICHQL